MWGATSLGSDLAHHSSISIHAPRVGSDSGDYALGFIAGLFQSTLPVWGATIEKQLLKLAGHISIHAPRVGSDLSGEIGLAVDQGFQSTLPVWGATRMLTTS